MTVDSKVTRSTTTQYDRSSLFSLIEMNIQPCLFQLPPCIPNDGPNSGELHDSRLTVKELNDLNIELRWEKLPADLDFIKFINAGHATATHLGDLNEQFPMLSRYPTKADVEDTTTIEIIVAWAIEQRRAERDGIRIVRLPEGQETTEVDGYILRGRL